jgi:non-specific serine/threonine protein kinase/serine/threonine-protein kinase
MEFEALQLELEARSRFLDASCANDANMRAEIEALLLADSHATPEHPESQRQSQPRTCNQAVAAGETIGQRYLLIRELGEGGMGQVWLGEQTTPVQRPVALKFIKAGMYDAAVVQRFASERRSLAIMDHPSIAKVFDAGVTTQGQPYFIMEYVPGLSITAYCDQRRASIRHCLEILIQACEGVQHAHQKAVIHRDLKPANILVVDVDGKPKPKIIDFGLARIVTAQGIDDPRQKQFAQFFGTPGYISPEQVDPDIQDVDTRADVYCLGVILYVLLTGTLPFESASGEKLPYDELVRRLRHEDVAPPSAKLVSDQAHAEEIAAMRRTNLKTLMRELRRDLDWIAIRALQRNRELRYATPSEFAADLRRYLSEEPVRARPPGMTYQIAKFLRRHTHGLGRYYGMNAP